MSKLYKCPYTGKNGCSLELPCIKCEDLNNYLKSSEGENDVLHSVSNSVCGAHEHYQCRFRMKGNKCKCKDECDMKVNWSITRLLYG